MHLRLARESEEGPIVNYRPGHSPVMLSLPHSGTVMPYRSHLDLDKAEARVTLDSGKDSSVPRITGFFDYTGPKVWTTLPRVILDVNRLESQIDNHSVEGGPETPDPHGLIWHASLEEDPGKITSILTKPYTQEALTDLLHTAYRPYHDKIRSGMEYAKNRYGHAVLFDLHSMWGNQVRTIEEGDYRGAYVLEQGVDLTRPDLVLLDKGPDVSDPSLGDLIVKVFRDNGLTIEKGSVRQSETPINRHGDPAKGHHAISIEIVEKDLVPGRGEGDLTYYPETEARLQQAFGQAIEALNSWSPPTN